MTAGRRAAALRLGLAVLLLAGACLGPRLVAFGGMGQTYPFAFGDMPFHLLRLDGFAARGRLSSAELARPVLESHQRTFQGSLKWPAGVYQAARPLALLFGPLSIWTVQGVNALFSALLLAAVYALGAALAGRGAGLFAALLTALSPWLLWSSWYFSLDLPLSAVVWAGLWLLWRTRGFLHPGWSVAFALGCALGLNVKLTYAIHLVGPGLTVAVVALWRGPRRRRRALYLALALVLALVLWVMLMEGYTLAETPELLRHLTDRTMLAGHQFEPWTWSWAAAYLYFALCELPYPLLIPALPGLWLLLRCRQPLLRQVLLPFALASALLLTLMVNKLPRYGLALYPLVPLLTALWVFARLPRPWRQGMVALLLVLQLVVLGLTFTRPTPWCGGPDRPAPPLLTMSRLSADDRGLLFELQALQPATRRGLRQLGLHPQCDLRPLARALARAAAAEPGGVSVALDAGGLGRELADSVSPDWITLLLAQAEARRLVLNATPPAEGPVGDPPAAELYLRLASGDEGSGPPARPRPWAVGDALLASERVTVRCRANPPLLPEPYRAEVVVAAYRSARWSPLR